MDTRNDTGGTLDARTKLKGSLLMVCLLTAASAGRTIIDTPRGGR